MRESLSSYLRVHRKGAALSQRELARVVGYANQKPVSRHELLNRLPPLLICIAYSIVLKKPLPELFPGLFEVVGQAVEGRLLELESELKKYGKSNKVTEKKLAWLSRRRQAA